MAVIRTDEQLETEIGKLASGQQAGVPQVTASKQTVEDTTLQGTKGTMLGTSPTAGLTKAEPTNITPDAPTATKDVGQLTEKQAFIKPSIGKMDSAQIGATQAVITDVPQGTVSQGAVATAPTQELDEKATTRYQLKELLSSLDEGTDVPAWASPAVRKVSAIMQARGLGSSSMAAAAMTQAVLESGTVIATQDANKYATIQLQNLAGQQKVATHFGQGMIDCMTKKVQKK